MLLEHISGHLREGEQHDLSARYAREARETERSAKAIRELAVNQPRVGAKTS